MNPGQDERPKKIPASKKCLYLSLASLFSTLFFTMNTPEWCGGVVLLLTAILAGLALIFQIKERQSDRWKKMSAALWP
ncbi:MAG: hypothetical protein WCL04_07155 [Verrucomicrobiota bacterium]